VGGGAIVRPHSHERPLMIRYLNAGADGLMVPMVNTAAQAEEVVDAVRYAMPSSHEKRLVVCMIETPEAIGNLDAMLKVEGVDVFFVGPSDLSQSMGFSPPPARWRGRWSIPTTSRIGPARVANISTSIPTRSCATASRPLRGWCSGQNSSPA
jgi:2-keto-3-deoxy-L-rhamnonate aldolase RhmA